MALSRAASVHRRTTRVALPASTVVGLPLMSNAATMSRQLGLLMPSPAGNVSVDSPVTDVNDVFDASPYALRIALYIGMPWSRPRWRSIAPRSTTPLKHCGMVGPLRQSGLLDVGIWNSVLRS